MFCKQSIHIRGKFRARTCTYQAKADAASKSKILSVVADLSVCKEESHGDESAYDHGSSSAPEEFAPAHISCQNWRRDGAEISNSIVAPVDRLRLFTKLCATSSQVGGQEDIVQWIGKTNEEPGEPDQGCRKSHTFGCEETAAVDDGLHGRKLGSGMRSRRTSSKGQ